MYKDVSGDYDIEVYLNEAYLSLQAEQGSFPQLVSPGTVAVVMQFFEKYEVMIIL